MLGLLDRIGRHNKIFWKKHENVWKEEEAGVIGIGTQPSFAIGQRALLIQTGA